MIVKHIGARKGSKGVPGKSMVEVCGKPLIEWSLRQLLGFKRPGPVVVSTDDERTYEHCVALGAADIGLRPENLAQDDTSKWEVWQHSLKQAEEIVDEPVTVFLDLDCTSPLRLEEDIEKAVALFERERPGMVMSCCVARKNPYFNLLEIDDNGSLQLSKKPGVRVVSRQQAPLVYEHAGSTYVLDPKYLRSASSLYEGHVIPYLMPLERCHDIDSELDLKIVSMLMEERHRGGDSA